MLRRRWTSHKASAAAHAPRARSAGTSASSVEALTSKPHPAPLVSERGSSLIEMAFIMLFLLMFIGAIVDFGGAFQQYIVLTNAAREGARRYALLPCKADNRTQVASAIENAVVDETGDSNVVLNASNVIITPDPRASCPAAGSPIVVAVERDYPVQFGEFLGSGPLRLHAEASMVYQGLD